MQPNYIAIHRIKGTTLEYEVGVNCKRIIVYDDNRVNIHVRTTAAKQERWMFVPPTNIDFLEMDEPQER